MEMRRPNYSITLHKTVQLQEVISKHTLLASVYVESKYNTLGYEPPTLEQLIQVKDNVGVDAYNLLNEQMLLHSIVTHSKNLTIQLHILNGVSQWLMSSQDYVSDERFLKRLGTEWTRLKFQDSLFVYDLLRRPSASVTILKNTYNSFHLSYKECSSMNEIKNLINYKFLGAAETQRIYFETVIEILKDKLPRLLILSDTFANESFEDFNQITNVLVKKYPKYRQYVNP